MKPIRKIPLALAALVILAQAGFVPGEAAAETIKVGMLKTSSPMFVAVEKGYFAAEGMTIEPAFFETAQPIATATVSGDIDIGLTAATAALYNLAGQGALRIVGGNVRETSGFQSTSYVVSNHAYAAGLTSFKDFPGHSVALPVLGSPPHYSLELLAEKYDFDMKSMRLLQLQTNPNQVSAVTGGQADIGLIQVTAVMPAIQRGDLKLIGWVGDETPWQLGLIIAATRTANERHDTVDRFLRNFRKGAHDYDAAFVGPDGKRADGPAAPEILAIMSKYTGLPVEALKSGVTYFDPDARVDVTDVLHQIDWYKSQGFVKPEIDANAIIDRRYVVPLSDKQAFASRPRP